MSDREEYIRRIIELIEKCTDLSLLDLILKLLVRSQ